MEIRTKKLNCKWRDNFGVRTSGKGRKKDSMRRGGYDKVLHKHA
jgi:hypothetical protein